MRFLLSLSVIATVAFVSCNQKKEIKTETEPQAIEIHTHTESETIELDNGAKWKVVPTMLLFLRSMEADVNHFSETKHAELTDYTRLGESLQKNIEQLTSNCTMEGKAHDELHKWLVPYIDLVDEFVKSETTETAAKHFTELKKAFESFNLYFE